MLVGVPKEIKDNEYRVGIVPSSVNLRHDFIRVGRETLQATVRSAKADINSRDRA
jgi:alanine dehydrogenase